MRSHVKDTRISKSIAFIDFIVSKKMVSLSDISAVINGWMMSVSLFNEPIYILNACVPQGEHIIDVSFPHQWLFCALIEDFCFNRWHK